ncbi:MAG: bifunctional folylpolyglutamate synthase/dihydrofolate synthase [Verrucomicrobia bacterium]|nr:bifunctional folylpolyglutamate synthase/dihydrofolate synthase [Cytophagales bacterium]
MTFAETIDFLYSQLPMFSRIGQVAYKANLDNTLALCEYLGNPERKFKSIHIAGTNGKGSSSHMLAAILQAAGYKTGLYTSPHLKSFTERIKLNGQEISQQAVVDFVVKHKAFIEKLQPSFFEMTVGMAFDFFAQNQVDIALVEVGLGGRLDSTNVLVPEVALITNISYDHQKLLGETLPEIALEKAGIIKKNIPVVISETQVAVSKVFLDKVRQVNATIEWAEETYSVHNLGFKSGKRLVKVLKKVAEYFGEFELLLDLLGEYQLKNLPGVLKTIEILQNRGWGISEAHIREALLDVVGYTGLKGRWQILQQKPLVVCDTGHNEGGIRQIIQQLQHIDYQKLYWVLGTVNDKNLDKILSILPQEANYFFCEPNIPRKMEAQQLAQQAEKYNLQGEVIQEVNQALERAKELASEKDMILVAGSNFIVAELHEI